jgi:hypothetical protein
VLHHALNAREINPDPLGQSALPNSRCIVEGREHRRLDGGQALWPGNLDERRWENPVEAPRQVELAATVNWRQCLPAVWGKAGARLSD